MYLWIIRLVALVALINFPASVATSQTVKPFTIAYLSVGVTTLYPPFIQMLRERGYEEGRNLKIEFRSAKGIPEALPKLAAELVSLKPDVLVGSTTPAALALKHETDAIPIVFLFVSDPVATGLVKSFANPGGNLTGAANATEVWEGKSLQLIAETLPGICCVTLLRNPSNQTAPLIQGVYEKAAKSLCIELRILDAANPEKLQEALASPLEDRFKTAVVVSPDGLFTGRGSQIAEFTQRQHIPLFAAYRADAVAGALIGFGASFDSQYGLAADYVDKILKGAKPTDLPVQQPTALDLVINLKVAKSLGIEIPQMVLARATELIE
jgi:putative ABC transport system substrate-binding protein